MYNLKDIINGFLKKYFSTDLNIELLSLSGILLGATLDGFARTFLC